MKESLPRSITSQANNNKRLQMSKDNRKFMVIVDGIIVAKEIGADDFDILIKDILHEGYPLDLIQVWVETSFRLIPERYEVD